MTPESAPQPRQNNEAVDYEVLNETILALQPPVLNSLLAGDEAAMPSWVSSYGKILRDVLTEYLKEGGDPEQIETMVALVRAKLEKLDEAEVLH